MSQALERVITEQQTEIDRLKAAEKYNIESWGKEHRRREALVCAVFTHLNYPDAPHSRTMVLDAIRAWGYCTICECSPCECEGQYD
jgi:hypothetical protein